MSKKPSFFDSSYERRQVNPAGLTDISHIEMVDCKFYADTRIMKGSTICQQRKAIAEDYRYSKRLKTPTGVLKGRDYEPCLHCEGADGERK